MNFVYDEEPVGASLLAMRPFDSTNHSWIHHPTIGRHGLRLPD